MKQSDQVARNFDFFFILKIANIDPRIKVGKINVVHKMTIHVTNMFRIDADTIQII